MCKTWVALAAVLLGAGLTSAHAADTAHGRLSGSGPSFATDYAPNGSLAAPKPEPAPAPASTSAPASEATPAPAPTPGCADCGARTAPSGPTRFCCVNRLIDWATYRPLHLGVKCATCCGDKGDCCRYHCAPPIYLFFLDHCKDGPPPAPPSCANGGCKDSSGPAGHGLWFPGQRLFLLHTGFGCGSVGCH
jgi:hypothetical protein